MSNPVSNAMPETKPTLIKSLPPPDAKPPAIRALEEQLRAIKHLPELNCVKCGYNVRNESFPVGEDGRYTCTDCQADEADDALASAARMRTLRNVLVGVFLAVLTVGTVLAVMSLGPVGNSTKGGGGAVFK